MKTLFHYNWQVRNEWFSWCEDIPEDELLKSRIGGVEGILKTLFHIVYWEYSWIHSMVQEKAEFNQEPFESHRSLSQVRDLSVQFHAEVEPFVASWTSEMERKELTYLRGDGEWISRKYGEILRHVIAHEIHHIGQLSVWARDIGREPITANLLGRNL